MISSCNSATDNRNSLSDLSSVMSVDRQSSPPIDSDTENTAAKNNTNNIVRRTRPSRACTVRSAARLHAAAAAEAAIVAAQRKKKRKERPVTREESPPSPSPSPSPPQDRQCSKIVTALVGEPEPSQLPRWNIRSMWELASILNFLNVFRTILNIKVEFSAEEFETALITPNITLADIHIPLLKAIPPIARMALGENTWITVLCRKLRDWWHWVADGELPIIASHGNEIEAYNTLDPGVRVVILKALCDIRVEQEDIRNYIDNSIKHGVHLSTFRKERIGGDSHGISYWYEDDPVIGQRLYREIRTVEVKKGKGKGVQPIPVSCYQWETAATNPDEFEDVSEKLFSSKNRTEASLGKKLKIDVLPEIEKVQKTKERLLKKQQRQALLLDNMMSVDGLPPGRSLRGRKNVSYTFDDYDRSITEAINVTKRKQSSPGPTVKREGTRSTSTNGRLGSPLEFSQQSFSMPSPESFDNDEIDEDLNYETFDRSRRRQRPERYSAKDFVEELSDNDAEFDSDDEIVGEAVYDDEYLKKRKEMRKMSSSSEGDEEYRWEGENVEEEEEEEEEEEDYSLSMSDDSGERPTRRSKKLPGRTRRETKLRSVGEFRSGLRRSNRATRNRVDYKKLEVSDSETESLKPEKSNASDDHTDASDNEEFTMESETEDSEPNYNDQDRDIESPAEEQFEAVEEDQPEEQFEAVDEDQPDEQFEAVDEDQPDEQFEAVDEDQHEAVDEEQFEAVDEDQPEAVDEEQPEAVYENQPKAMYRNQHEAAEEEKIQFPHKADSAVHNEADIIQKRGFLDLNELAPGSGFDDGPNSIMKGDDTDNF